MAQIGFVTKQQDGSYEGHLKTVSIKAPIRIVLNGAKMPESAQPDFRVMTGDVEIGAGWHRVSQAGNTHASLTLAAPEFGPRALYANLGRAADQDDDDVFAIIWNPSD